MSAFTISFGVPGSEQAWYFRNGPEGFRPIDVSRLPGPSPEFSNVRAQLTASYVAEGFSGQLLYARRMQGTETGGVDAFDQLGDWNTVKNLQLLSDGAQSMVLDGFVHVDAEIGLNDTSGSTLVLSGTKRANVITGEGADVIYIRMVSDVNSIWVDTFRINSGGGDDLVSFTGLDIATERAAGDKTYIQAANKPGFALDPTGEGRTSYSALGTGDDRFIGFTSDDHIAGQEDRGTVQVVRADKATGSFAYAIGGSTAKSGCDSILYRVDLRTGAATQVGKVAIGLGWFGSVGGLDIESLALSLQDGQLYGFASKFGILDALVRIDPATAKATYIKLNYSGLRAKLQDMVFNAADNLFLIANGDFMKVNTATGGIATSGNNTLNGKIGAMAIDSADRVFAIGDEGGRPVLYEIKKLNGKVLTASKLSGFDTCPAVEAMSFDAAGALIAIDKDSGGVFTVNMTTKPQRSLPRRSAMRSSMATGSKRSRSNR
jgi:hypothetical protein